MKKFTLSGLAASVALASMIASPMAAFAKPNDMNLWFADKYATAYYAIDVKSHEIVTLIEPGPNGAGNATRNHVTLKDGDTYEQAIDGQGNNALTTTLTVVRNGDDMSMKIITTPRDSISVGSIR